MLLLPQTPVEDPQDLMLIVLGEAVRSTHIIDKLTALIADCPSRDPVDVAQLHAALASMTETRASLLTTAERLSGE